MVSVNLQENVFTGFFLTMSDMQLFQRGFIREVNRGISEKNITVNK